MATLSAAISNAVTKSLLAKLPTEASSKFNVDESEFKEFLQTFLTSQLGKAAKGGRTGGPKGKNGKGRISGFILFSNENREGVKASNPNIEFKEVGRKLGEMWRELDEEAKSAWNAKAAAHNEANGLPTPTPTPAKTPARGRGRKTPAAESGEMKVVRDKEAKKWVVDGTNFVVQSAKNKVVVGKLRAGKVVALSSADTKTCESNGWEVRAAPVKSRKSDE